MNIVDPYGPVGIDELEESVGTGGGSRGARQGDALIHLKEQLARKVKSEQHLQQQVERLLTAATSSRFDEQNRRQEILRELYAEQTRRQEAETDACAQRHHAAELEFLVKSLEAEVEALSGLPRGARRERTQGIDPDQTQVQEICRGLQDAEREPNVGLGITDDVFQLQTEVKILREQVVIHREDWGRENKEKLTVQQVNEQLKAELEQTVSELSATRAKLFKMEGEKEMLIADSRLFKENCRSFQKEWPKDETIKKHSFLEEKILNNLPGGQHIDNSFVKHRPLHIANNAPPSHTQLGSKMCTVSAPTVSSEGWSCPRCTLVNVAITQFCEVCGERRKQQSRPYHRQQQADQWRLSQDDMITEGISLKYQDVPVKPLLLRPSTQHRAMKPQ